MSEVNSNVAVEDVLSSGGAFVMAAFGRAPIVHRWTTGVGSTLPARSTARAHSSCCPGNRPSMTSGFEHDPNATLSRAHSKCASPSFDPKTKLAIVLVVSDGGADSKNVSGARSTDHS
jgi:hypothetical protein